jgi:hypothetical protein
VRSSVFATSSLLAFLTVTTIASQGQAPPPANPPANQDAAVLADFKARVDKYVDLTKKADDSAPPLKKKTEDPADIKAAQQALVERIGAARAGAKQGDIFTPEIAKIFRRILRPESKEKDAKEILKEDKPNPATVSYKINGPYPDKQPLATMPPEMLAKLPQLPKDIEYRFVEKHMILRDARANTIIDYIPNAIP